MPSNTLSSSSKSILRNDGTPTYLSIKPTIHGPAICLRGRGVDTLVRVTDFIEAYDLAIARLLLMHDIPIHNVYYRRKLKSAIPAVLRRYKYELKSRVIHEIRAL